MPVTKVGIVYSKSQNRIRRVILSDFDDGHIDRHKNYLLQGEGWLEIPLNTYNALTKDSIDDHIETLLGGKASSHTCAVIDANNTIIACVCADPVIDDHPDGVIIQEDGAEVGAVYDFENAQVVQS